MSKNKKSRIPSLPEPQTNLLKNSEALLLGFDKKHSEQIPNVSLKYIDTDYQCFSDWNKDELKAFSSFLKKLSQTTWTDVLKSGGGDKSGFGYTVHKDRDKLPRQKHLDQFSEDITFFELRITQRARVHGFRVKSVFFLIFLDKDHEVYKE